MRQIISLRLIIYRKLRELIVFSCALLLFAVSSAANTGFEGQSSPHSAFTRAPVERVMKPRARNTKGASATRPARRPPPTSNIAACRVQLEAKLPLTRFFGFFTVPAEIDGRTYPMVVDTGSDQTTIEPAMANVWHLQEDKFGEHKVTGLGGEAGWHYPRILSSLKLGAPEWIDLRVSPTSFAFVAKRAREARLPAPIGFLGSNILTRYDVELDFPARTMALYSVSNCVGRFVPWSGQFTAFSADLTRRNRFVLHISANGHPIRAVIDTGAETSIAAKASIAGTGADLTAIEKTVPLYNFGWDGEPIASYRHSVDLEVGAERFPSASIEVGDIVLPDFDMVLGMDYLRGRRVWLSYSTGWVFMQRMDAS